MSVEPLKLVPKVLSQAGPAAIGSPHSEVSSTEMGSVDDKVGTGVGVVGMGSKAGARVDNEVSSMVS